MRPDVLKTDPLSKNIRSGLSLGDRYRRRVEKRGPDDCWLWTGTCSPRGYGLIGAGERGKGPIGAHVLAFRLEHGRWPEPFALHSCDNPPCQNPRHIHEGTHADNMREASERGRFVAGPGSPRKYSETKIAAILKRRAEGAVLRTLVEEFGLSLSYVGAICRGEVRGG